MSFSAKRELLVQVAPRYRAARHGERSAILNEFIAVTGYDRKYAIRVLLGPIQPPAPIRRSRRAYYGREVQEALASAWLAANGICAKRLVPFLVELILVELMRRRAVDRGRTGQSGHPRGRAAGHRWRGRALSSVARRR